MGIGIPMAPNIGPDQTPVARTTLRACTSPLVVVSEYPSPALLTLRRAVPVRTRAPRCSAAPANEPAVVEGSA